MTTTNVKPQKHLDKTLVLRHAGMQEHEKLGEVMAAQSSQRRKLLDNECGRDFTILGPDNMKWHISVHLMTAYSGVVKRAYLESNPRISSFSLASYKPLYIDAMVKMAYTGIYSLKRPLAYKVVADAAVHNAKPNPDNTTHPILLHFGVYALAKDIEYEDLATIALNHMRQFLMDDPPLPFATFLTLKNKVWDDNTDLKDNDIRNLRAAGEELPVRKLLATYAAGWDGVWKKKFRNLWEMHMSSGGSSDGFAFWVRKARRAIKREAKKMKRGRDGKKEGREISDSELEDYSESESDD